MSLICNDLVLLVKDLVLCLLTKAKTREGQTELLEVVTFSTRQRRLLKVDIDEDLLHDEELAEADEEIDAIERETTYLQTEVQWLVCVGIEEGENHVL